jgi:hypothetical protein
MEIDQLVLTYRNSAARAASVGDLGAKPTRLWRGIALTRKYLVDARRHDVIRQCLQSCVLLVAMVVPAAAAADSSLTEGVVVPTSFEDGRIYVEMPVPSRRAPLHVLTDTGGGSFILSKDAASRLRLTLVPERSAEVMAEMGPDTWLGEPTPFIRRQWIALPAKTQFLVIPQVKLLSTSDRDGIFGQQWFADHVWTWDYPHKKLILRPPSWHPSNARPLQVTFKTDKSRNRLSDFPRIVVRVDGEELPMLYDTGATTILTPGALEAVADKSPALRSTSMIAHSTFERWRTRHPDWRIVDDAQVATHARMILVPEVEITGRKSRAAWFTERPDKAFYEFMTQLMSDHVEGSIGGNVLADFVISIDYPRAKAWLQ